MEVTSPAEYDPDMGWGTNYKANLRTVLELKNTVPVEQLRREPRLAPASYLQRSRPLGASVLPDWPAIEDVIAKTNRGLGVREALTRFKPRAAESRAEPPGR